MYLKGLTNLSLLDVYGTLVADAGKKEPQHALPKLKIMPWRTSGIANVNPAAASGNQSLKVGMGLYQPSAILNNAK